MIKAAADASERFLLVLVLVVAAAGVAAPAPGRALAAGNGIDAALAVLVFATGLSLRLADLAAVRLAWRRIAVVLLVSTAALPALAWAASQLIGDPVLRSGMQAAGVAPAEVATVALCVIAGGDAAVCADAAGGVHDHHRGGGGPDPVAARGVGHRVLGGAARQPRGRHRAAAGRGGGAAHGLVARPGVDAGVRLVTVLALLLLLWQVASQIRLDSAYVKVIVALVVYVAGSAALGWVLALRAPAGQATAILLPVAMRDFAVAAGIAAAAFGPAAAAPLGAYGVLVLLAGSLAAIIARRRPAPAGGTGPAQAWCRGRILIRPSRATRRSGSCSQAVVSRRSSARRPRRPVRPAVTARDPARPARR